VESSLWPVPDLVEGIVVVGRLGREVADRRGRVALDFDRGRVGERDEDLADAELEQLGLQVVCQTRRPRRLRMNDF